MQWILEHLTEILVGALGALFSIIIALLTYIGNDKISSLEKKTDLAITEIQKTNCELNTLTAKDRLEDFEARFLGRSMEDLTLNSAELERLKGFRDKYSSLGTCVWPAPGFTDTELGVLMEPEVCHGATEVYAGV
jgi:hypothetical protein